MDSNYGVVNDFVFESNIGNYKDVEKLREQKETELLKRAKEIHEKKLTDIQNEINYQLQYIDKKINEINQNINENQDELSTLKFFDFSKKKALSLLMEENKNELLQMQTKKNSLEHDEHNIKNENIRYEAECKCIKEKLYYRYPTDIFRESELYGMRYVYNIIQILGGRCRLIEVAKYIDEHLDRSKRMMIIKENTNRSKAKKEKIHMINIVEYANYLGGICDRCETTARHLEKCGYITRERLHPAGVVLTAAAEDRLKITEVNIIDNFDIFDI